VKIVKPSVELLWITPEPYKHIEMSGRVCYKSEDKITKDSAVKFCSMIKQRGHESVVEHAVASFKIICDRGVSHEIVRHRLASYSQESTRYCNYSKDKFDNGISLSPMMTGLNDFQIDRRVTLWQHIEDVYLAEIADGVSPQQARDNLPTCLKTEIVMTANFREWMHFINLRTSPAAHPQIRPVAEEIRLILAEYCPTIFVAPNHGSKTMTFTPEERAAILHALSIDGEINPTMAPALLAAMEKMK
jgi:thymidylate synthase (FAD)